MNEIIEANFDQDYRAALDNFLARAMTAFGDRILSATLYGSKARGDDAPDSDVDVVLIVSADDPDLYRGLVRLAARISLEYNILLDPRVIPAERWEHYAKLHYPLWENVQRDGILLNLTRELA